MPLIWEVFQMHQIKAFFSGCLSDLIVAFLIKHVTVKNALLPFWHNCCLLAVLQENQVFKSKLLFKWQTQFNCNTCDQLFPLCLCLDWNKTCLYDRSWSFTISLSLSWGLCLDCKRDLPIIVLQHVRLYLGKAQLSQAILHFQVGEPATCCHQLMIEHQWLESSSCISDVIGMVSSASLLTLSGHQASWPVRGQ